MGNLTTYDLIERVESDPLYLHLFKKGVISLSLLNYKVYYERYQSELKRHKKCQAITNTAIEFCVDERTIRRAIKMMTS